MIGRRWRRRATLTAVGVGGLVAARALLPAGTPPVRGQRAVSVLELRTAATGSGPPCGSERCSPASVARSTTVATAPSDRCTAMVDHVLPLTRTTG
jgi:hypothetical protein